MFNCFFIALAGLSGLFSPRLEMGSKQKFENNSSSWNVATTSSKWRINSTFPNKPSSDWKYGWRGFGSGPKIKNASLETGSSEVTLNSSKWMNEGWGSFVKRHGKKLHKHFTNLRGKFRSVKHSSSKTTTANMSNKEQEVHDGKAQNAEISAKLVDDKIIEITKKEERDLTEQIRNLTQTVRFVNQEAEKLESEAETVELEVRRLEKEMKILVRNIEKQRDLHDKLNAKTAEFERIQTEVRHKRMEAKELDFQLQRKDVELKSVQNRVKRYESLRNETRDSHEKSQIIEAAENMARELAAKISRVNKVAEDFKRKSEQQSSLERISEDKTTKKTNEQVMSSKKYQRLNVKVQRKTEKLRKINARIQFFKDIEKAVRNS